MNTKNALIISGVNWDSPWQRHHIISSRLLESGYNVDFIESITSSSLSFKNIKRKINNLLASKVVFKNNNAGVRLIKTPVSPPSSITNILDRITINLILSKTKKHYDIVIIYIPRKLTFDLLQQLNYSKLIYDCVRDFSTWPDISKQVVSYESNIISIANEIWCDSYWLEKKISTFIDNKGIVKKVTKILPTIPKEIFDKIEYNNFHIGEIKRITYFGSLSNHVDITALKFLYDNGFLINFIGKSDIKVPDFIIEHDYVTSQLELFEKIIAISDAIIIPYLGNMNGVIPSKLMLSLATGKPVFISSFYDSDYLASLNLLPDQLFCYKRKDEILIKINEILAVESTHHIIEKKQLNCLAFLENNCEETFDDIF